MNNKKGISPLIATVLLIGFTIVLAAVVIRWGGDFISETTETTTCESDLATVCATQINVEAIDATLNVSSNDTVTIRNNADFAIDKFTVVVNDDTGATIATVESPIAQVGGGSGLGAFKQDVFILTGVTAITDGKVYTIEVVPYVTVDAEIACAGFCSENRATWTETAVV